MDKIPLTNYQFIAYFLPGFVFEFAFFLSFEEISGFHSLTFALKDVGIPFFVLFLLLAFAVGLIIDAIRNSSIDNWLDQRIKKGRLSENYEVNWAFFHEGDGKTVGYFYARYFTYYCFDWNMALAMLISTIALLVAHALPYLWIISVLSGVAIFFLGRDAMFLRDDMREATKLPEE